MPPHCRRAEFEPQPLFAMRRILDLQSLTFIPLLPHALQLAHQRSRIRTRGDARFGRYSPEPLSARRLVVQNRPEPMSDPNLLAGGR